mmetsp:Transcript_36626/g.56191  ORF Transcript_36626/g.56191 Transcript_36626/m.56191 type:complete len:81 (+) Transcript_36626:1055-1297(+)
MHEAQSDLLNLVNTNAKSARTLIPVDERMVEYTTEQFAVEELDSEAVFRRMMDELRRCLQLGGINYLTAAYYLSLKHEFD